MLDDASSLDFSKPLAKKEKRVGREVPNLVPWITGKDQAQKPYEVSVWHGRSSLRNSDY